jgi:hypothetical protein
MAAKKTLEELRASGAARAKRWREKNRKLHLERVKEVYGRSRAQKHSYDGVTPGELERYERREVQETVRVGMDEVEADPQVMAQQEAYNRARGRVAGLMGPDKRVVVPPDLEITEVGSEPLETSEELKVARALAAFIKRKIGIECEV